MAPQTESTTVVVVAGGAPPEPTLARVLPAGAPVVVADSGLAHAIALGLDVDAVVGDLDSVDHEALARAEAQGAVVERHRTDKDETDLELALDRAVRMGARAVTVVGGHGLRADHHLANLGLLAAPRYAAIRVTAWHGRALLHVVRDAVVVTGRPGSTVSLVPVHGTAAGVRTDGLRFPLMDEDLGPGTTRGVSNTLLAPRATVSVRSGVLLVVQPDALSDVSDPAGADAHALDVPDQEASP